MSPSVQHQFIEVIKIVSLGKGEKLYAQGDEGNGFHCVLEGRIQVSNLHISGKQMVLAYLDVGSWFGEISMFDGKPRTHDTFADHPSLLAFIRKADFHRLLVKHPEVYQYFNQLLCQRLRTAFNFIDASANQSLKQQLARRLVLLSSNFGQPLSGYDRFEITASQETLAMMLNLSRQTVNRLLKEMEQDNVLRVHYGRITLLNIEHLKTMCAWN